MLRLPSRQLLRCLRGSLGLGGEEVLGSNTIIVASISTFPPSLSIPPVKPTRLFVQHGGLKLNSKQAFSSKEIIDDLKEEENSPEISKDSQVEPVEGQREKSEQKVVTLTGLLQLTQRKAIHHKTALYFVANLAKLKKDGLAKEEDYKAGLQAVLMELEGAAVKDMQPLALISCLKVQDHKLCKTYS